MLCFWGSAVPQENADLCADTEFLHTTIVVSEQQTGTGRPKIRNNA